MHERTAEQQGEGGGGGDRWWDSMQRILKMCQKSIKLIPQQGVWNTVCFHAFSERWYDSRLFSCRFIVGGDSLEGQLVNSWAPEIEFFFTHVFTRVLSSQQRKPLTRAFRIHPLVLLEQAATELVWTAVIFNGSEASEPLTNGRTLKMYSWAVYKIFWRPNGVRANPLETPHPLPTGLIFKC